MIMEFLCVGGKKLANFSFITSAEDTTEFVKNRKESIKTSNNKYFFT